MYIDMMVCLTIISSNRQNDLCSILTGHIRIQEFVVVVHLIKDVLLLSSTLVVESISSCMEVHPLNPKSIRPQMDKVRTATLGFGMTMSPTHKQGRP